MISVTPEQAIAVWTQLEKAYHGEHGFGGNTAEIYCYLVQARNPLIDGSHPRPGSLGFDDSTERAKQTAQVFDWLFTRFMAEYPDAIIQVDDSTLAEWRVEQLPKGEDHRLHINITRRTNE